MTTSLAPSTRALPWMVLFRGVLAILFGIVAIIAPGAALTGIAIGYGAYVLIDGVVAIVHAVRSRSTGGRWGWLLGGGILSVLAGIVVLAFPGAAGALGGYIVLWTIVIFSVMHGVTLLMSSVGATAAPGRALGIVSGILTILMGVVLAVVLFVVPDAGLLGLIWIVGIYAIVFGVVLVVLSLRLRTARGQ
jgi:uncharacterized membrane protein HdeD (DUF308 family)